MISEVLAVLTSILALGWLWQAVAALRGVPTLPDLTQTDLARGHSPQQSRTSYIPNIAAPDVTVIVPACNEEDSIQSTLRSLLASTGPRLQIIAIDDRSTDKTAERMDAIAAEAATAGGPHSLEVIHNRELPQGWLGKVHALALGAERAKAPWLLFTDGDVSFDPRACALALDRARSENADHLVLVFTLQFESAAEAAILAAFNAIAGWNVRLWKVADPKARDFFGAGGFNLVRREVYEAVGGFAGLRMEVLEDLRLGWKIKRAGFAQRVVLGPGLVRIRWIKGAFGIVGLLEKNGFAVSQYRVAICLLGLSGFAIHAFLPLAAIVSGGWATVPGLLVYVFIYLVYYANRRVTQVSPWLALAFAPASAVLIFAVTRSMILALWRGGVVWRGTLYPLKDLRRNATRGW